jgi:hypothetical protein
MRGYLSPRGYSSLNSHGFHKKRPRRLCFNTRRALQGIGKDYEAHQGEINEPGHAWQNSRQREHKNNHVEGRMTNHVDSTKGAR